MSSTLSVLETSTSLHYSSNRSLLENKKINKIKKSLFNFAKEELTSFNSLKVKIYKEKTDEQKDENKIKIPETSKPFFEDFKKKKIKTQLNKMNQILLLHQKLPILIGLIKLIALI